MKMRPKCAVVLLLATIVSSSRANIWDAGDAIILDSGTDEDDSSDVTTISPDTFDADDDQNNCLTNEGVVGSCIPFDVCYPYLSKKDGVQRAQDLYESTMNVSTPCTPPEETTVHVSPGAEGSGNGYVCCSTLSRLAESNNLPKYPGNFENEVEVSARNAAELRSSCGTRAYQADKVIVVMGREAKIGEFPWTVAIINKNRHHCGGTLINSRTVVTAAHCVNFVTSRGMMKRLSLSIGDHDLYTKQEVKNERRELKRVVYHKKFSGSSYVNDVALLIFEKPVTFSGNIQTACLNDGQIRDYDNGRNTGQLSGWGLVQHKGQPAKKLQTAGLRIWRNSECSEMYRGTPAPPIGSGMVCAGTQGRDACQGDSGGPLVVNYGGRSYLVGIVSWGIGCGRYPGVYTRVDKYTSWIKKYQTST